MDSDYDVVSTMKEEIKALREVFGKRVSQGLLEQIENRFIIFMVDGSDIQQILDTHDDFMPAIDGKKQYPSKVNVNINRYIAKYNFEIASVKMIRRWGEGSGLSRFKSQKRFLKG
jgi:hypothetical protein